MSYTLHFFPFVPGPGIKIPSISQFPSSHTRGKLHLMVLHALPDGQRVGHSTSAATSAAVPRFPFVATVFHAVLERVEDLVHPVHLFNSLGPSAIVSPGRSRPYAHNECNGDSRLIAITVTQPISFPGQGDLGLIGFLM